MMRRLLTTTLALPLLFANSSFSKALRFVGGSYYVSDYKEGKGIASLLMTGNAEYMVIYADQNKCGRGGACQLSAFKDDV